MLTLAKRVEVLERRSWQPVSERTEHLGVVMLGKPVAYGRAWQFAAGGWDSERQEWMTCTKVEGDYYGFNPTHFHPIEQDPVNAAGDPDGKWITAAKTDPSSPASDQPQSPRV
jgi:hypothetical protein